MYCLAAVCASKAMSWLRQLICQPLTSEPQVQAQVSPYGICGVQSATGTVFSLSTAVFPYQYHSLSFHQRSVLTFIYTLLNQDTWAKPGNFPESNAILEIGENWIEKYFRTSKS
jgi:hypothetical protein